ncbi:MAG: RagB/SusD family nutrient uptake outer membrane protein [Prevotella sp.]|nr:RagB/SusD family nutrient uptake outer membrane protein [Prevotella sp.]
MKTKRTIYSVLAIALAGMTLSSCSDKLDTMPDNRTVLDSEEKIADLLTRSYPQNSNILLTELMSDNADYFGTRIQWGDVAGDQMYFWQDFTESGNDSPENLWMEYNKCVAQANQALADIDKLGGPTTKALTNSYGEALLIRAYNNFLLANVFCMPYNSKTSSKDLGIYYSTKVERLDARNPRGTVADVYASIAADIEKGIPMINDNFKVAKYHFNKRAAYAFAARFYLYYEKWDKAVDYADRLIGSSVSGQLRDYRALSELPFSDSETVNKVCEAYCAADANCNLLITVPISEAGMALGAWKTYKRYSHDNYLADNETINAIGSLFSCRPVMRGFTMRSADADGVMFPKLPREIEWKDQVAGTGYLHTMNVEFSVDETLLVRAEALTMLGRYAEAAADLTAWLRNYYNTSATLTPENIKQAFDNLAYSYADADKFVGTPKKHLHPAFAIDAEGSVQESMLQCVLDFRRIETLHQGLRWFDVKRYNIEIPRREMGRNGRPSKNIDWLKQNDPRQAVQMPISIQEAGIELNPRG